MGFSVPSLGVQETMKAGGASVEVQTMPSPPMRGSKAVACSVAVSGMWDSLSLCISFPDLCMPHLHSLSFIVLSLPASNPMEVRVARTAGTLIAIAICFSCALSDSLLLLLIDSVVSRDPKKLGDRCGRNR